MERYIPLLIFLGTILFSILGRKKKHKEITHETMLPGKRKGEVISDRQLPESFDSSPRNTSYKKPVKPASSKQEIKKEKEKEKSSFEEITNDVQFVEDETNLPFALFEEEDEVKRAIVYSEIINRKTY